MKTTDDIALEGLGEFDIELPEVEMQQSSKVRIHISDNGCESCSA